MSGTRQQDVQISEVDSAEKTEGLGLCGYILTALSVVILVAFFPLSLCCSLKVLQEYERGIILRLGKVVPKTKGPGLVLVLPCIDELRMVDIRTFFYDIQPQKVLTRDSMTVTVDAVVYAKIHNVRQGALSGNIPLLTGRWAATALCKVLGSKSLTEILGDREQITNTLKKTLYKSAYRRGVVIERVEIKNVQMPVEMQRAMAVEAETTREAKAKVIAADGEIRASKALKDAACVMDQSPAALKLRYIQTLHNIAAERNNTVVVPIPMGLLRRLAGRR